MTTLHNSTFDYLKPSDDQMAGMTTLREAAKVYASVVEATMPEGPDKTYVLRHIRTAAMWANVGMTRNADGTPRE